MFVLIRSIRVSAVLSLDSDQGKPLLVSFWWRPGLFTVTTSTLCRSHAALALKKKEEVRGEPQWRPPIRVAIRFRASRIGEIVISLGEALVVRAQTGGCSVPFSEDFQKVREIDGVRIVNPFRVRGAI